MWIVRLKFEKRKITASYWWFKIFFTVHYEYTEERMLLSRDSCQTSGQYLTVLSGQRCHLVLWRISQSVHVCSCVPLSVSASATSGSLISQWVCKCRPYRIYSIHAWSLAFLATVLAISEAATCDDIIHLQFITATFCRTSWSGRV